MINYFVKKKTDFFGKNGVLLQITNYILSKKSIGRRNMRTIHHTMYSQNNSIIFQDNVLKVCTYMINDVYCRLRQFKIVNRQCY